VIPRRDKRYLLERRSEESLLDILKREFWCRISYKEFYIRDISKSKNLNTCPGNRRCTKISLISEILKNRQLGQGSG